MTFYYLNWSGIVSGVWYLTGGGAIEVTEKSLWSWMIIVRHVWTLLGVPLGGQWNLIPRGNNSWYNQPEFTYYTCSSQSFKKHSSIKQSKTSSGSQITLHSLLFNNKYRSTIRPIFILQKKVTRIINMVWYGDHTNPLFLQSKLLKFKDLMELQTVQTVQIIFKAKKTI